METMNLNEVEHHFIKKVTRVLLLKNDDQFDFDISEAMISDGFYECAKRAELRRFILDRYSASVPVKELEFLEYRFFFDLVNDIGSDLVKKHSKVG